MVKCGMNHDKNRRVLIRADGLYFLSIPTAPGDVEVLKRHVPIGKITALELRDNSLAVRIKVKLEHDVVITAAEREFVDRFLKAVDRSVRAAGVSVRASRKPTLKPRDGEVNLQKDPQRYLSIERKMELRAQLLRKSVGSIGRPPFTLAQWDSLVLAQPPIIEPSKMSKGLQKTLAGLPVVMVGQVSVAVAQSHTELGEPKKTRTIAFSTSRVYLIDDETCDVTFTASLFSIIAVVLKHSAKSISLLFAEEAVPGITFLFPKPVDSKTYASDNISTIATSIAFLINRCGYELPVSEFQATPAKGFQPPPAAVTLSQQRGGSLPQALPQAAAAAAGTGAQQPPAADNAVAAAVVAAPPAPSNLPPPTTTAPTSAAAAPMAATPEPKQSAAGGARPRSATVAMLDGLGIDEASVASIVPDFRKPQGDIAKRFDTKHTLLARRVFRLTSSKAWTPRVIVILALNRMLVCSDDGAVRRTIPIDQISSLHITHHWQGAALAIGVRGEHDLVIRQHDETPSNYSIAHIAAVLVQQSGLRTSRSVSTSSLHLKEVLGDTKQLNRASNIRTPADEMKGLQNGSVSMGRSFAMTSSNNSLNSSPQQQGTTSKSDTTAAQRAGMDASSSAALQPSVVVTTESFSQNLSAPTSPRGGEGSEPFAETVRGIETAAAQENAAASGSTGPKIAAGDSGRGPHPVPLVVTEHVAPVDPAGTSQPSTAALSQSDRSLARSAQPIAPAPVETTPPPAAARRESLIQKASRDSATPSATAPAVAAATTPPHAATAVMSTEDRRRFVDEELPLPPVVTAPAALRTAKADGETPRHRHANDDYEEAVVVAPPQPPMSTFVHAAAAEPWDADAGETVAVQVTTGAASSSSTPPGRSAMPSLPIAAAVQAHGYAEPSPLPVARSVATSGDGWTTSHITPYRPAMIRAAVGEDPECVYSPRPDGQNKWAMFRVMLLDTPPEAGSQVFAFHSTSAFSDVLHDVQRRFTPLPYPVSGGAVGRGSWFSFAEATVVCICTDLKLMTCVPLALLIDALEATSSRSVLRHSCVSIRSGPEGGYEWLKVPLHDFINGVRGEESPGELYKKQASNAALSLSPPPSAR